MLLLSIPEPCHENWNEMLPRDKGAFCAACSKVVIDFTNLSDDDVKNYFLHNRGQQTCGRFKNTQLSSPEISLDKLLAGSIPFWKKFLAIIVILFGSFLTGCEEPTKGKVTPEKFNLTTGVTILNVKEPVVIGEPKMEECTTVGTVGVITIDTLVMDEGLMGLIEYMPIDSATLIKAEVPKRDIIKKAETGKNSCDSLQTDKTIYYKP
jgi:hypothetical protein